jgi:hypothetical protein
MSKVNSAGRSIAGVEDRCAAICEKREVYGCRDALGVSPKRWVEGRSLSGSGVLGFWEKMDVDSC